MSPNVPGWAECPRCHGKGGVAQHPRCGRCNNWGIVDDSGSAPTNRNQTPLEVLWERDRLEGEVAELRAALLAARRKSEVGHFIATGEPVSPLRTPDDPIGPRSS